MGSVVLQDQIGLRLTEDVAIDVVEELAELDAAVVSMMIRGDLPALDRRARVVWESLL